MLALGQKWWHLFGYRQMNTWHLHLLIIKRFMICRKGTSGQKLTPQHWCGAQKLCLRGNNFPQRCLEGADKQRDLKERFLTAYHQDRQRTLIPNEVETFCLGVSLPQTCFLPTLSHSCGQSWFFKIRLQDCILLNIYSLPKDFIHITDNITVSPHKGCQQIN